jgi:hypothetical protein
MQSEYWKYRKAVDLAIDAVAKARKSGEGLAESEGELQHANALWEQFGYKTIVGTALANVLRLHDVWYEASERHVNSEQVFAIGDDIPIHEFMPSYTEWQDDSSWIRLTLRNAKGQESGRINVKVVQCNRAWLDWTLLRKGEWEWQGIKPPLSRGLEEDKKGTDSLMTLVPVSLILGRDLVINDSLTGFSLSDLSRSHVRIVGVISRIVPPCP